MMILFVTLMFFSVQNADKHWGLYIIAALLSVISGIIFYFSFLKEKKEFGESNKITDASGGKDEN